MSDRILHPTLFGRIFVLAVALGYPTLVLLAVRHGVVDGVPPIGLAFVAYVGLALPVPLWKLLRKVVGQKVILHADGVELVGPGSQRARMQWADAAGYRISGVSLVLVPREDRSRPLAIESHFDLPSVRRGLPAELQELPAAERSVAVPSRGARFKARMLDVAVVSLYAIGRGPRTVLAIASLLPIGIVLTALSRGANRFVLVSEDANSPRLVMFAGLPVAIWALFEAAPVSDLAPWALAIGGAGALALLIRAVQPDAWSPLFGGLYLPGLAAWSVGVLLAANALLDTAPPERHRAAVVERVEKNWKDPVLVLGPWGPIREPTRLRVRPAVHEVAEVGGTVEVALHRGALGIRWYEIERASGR